MNIVSILLRILKHNLKPLSCHSAKCAQRQMATYERIKLVYRHKKNSVA
jgi:hypothetical protein